MSPAERQKKQIARFQLHRGSVGVPEIRIAVQVRVARIDRARQQRRIGYLAKIEPTQITRRKQVKPLRTDADNHEIVVRIGVQAGRASIRSDPDARQVNLFAGEKRGAN